MYSLMISALLILGSGDMSRYQWYEGAIRTTDGEKIEGNFAIVYSHETLLLQNGKAYRAIPAFKISDFQFYDQGKNIRRKYRVILNEDGNKRKYEFYEEVVGGNMNVVRKKKRILGIDKFDNYQQDRRFNFLRHATRYESDNYNYFVYEEGSLVPIQKFKKRILSKMMDKYGNEISDFVNSRGIKTLEIVDCVRLVCFYNELERMRNSTISLN